MDKLLLGTKVGVPPPPKNLLPRGRLTSLLEKEVPRHRLTLVTCPAGFGKTTMLADWVSNTQLPAAWLTVEPNLVDVAWWLRYLMAAWEAIDPEIRRSQPGLLLEPIEVDVDRVLRSWINESMRLDGDVALIIDDAHLIPAGSMLDALAFLIENMAERVHFVLSSRVEPDLQLARYRARAQTFELGASDLAFASPEAGAMIRKVSGRALSSSDAKTLSERMGGWAAALQLASLAAGRTDKLPDFTGSNAGLRFVIEFVREEVLAGLEHDLRTWLLQVSVLDRLCGSLCDAVTGGNAGQLVLEELERRQLFLTPIDSHREWFRLHPVFRDVLSQERSRSHSVDVSELHRRAAKWYLQRELPDDAFDHALAAGDGDLVAKIAEDYAVMRLSSGELESIRLWLERIPATWLDEWPELGLMKMAYLVFTGDFANAGRTLDAVELQLRHSGIDRPDMKLARVAAGRCAMACFANDVENAERFGAIALEGLSADNEVDRANIYHALADTYRRNWRYAEAKRYYFEALTFTNNPAARIQSVHIYGALADLELEQGHLRTAERYWQRARQAVESGAFWGRLPVPVIGWVYIRLAELHYEWNELQEAAQLLELGIERARLGGDKRALIAAGVIGSAIEHARGDSNREAQWLDEASEELDVAVFPEWRCRLERRSLERELTTGGPRAVEAWCEGNATLEAAGPFDDIIRLTQLRALVCQQQTDRLDHAEGVAEALTAIVEQSGRTGSLIEAQALWALARQAKGDITGALIPLERSLRLAESEGYVRLFLDLGSPMARLLHEARMRNVMRQKAEQLLEAFGNETERNLPGQRYGLVEPLSARELEVLRLMAVGMTNREIGDRLFISSETVKKHAASLFAKLGCANRTEAAARARELDLLEVPRVGEVAPNHS